MAGLLGSGRTETAKAIYGAQPLDSGSVEVDGRSIAAGSPRAALSAGLALLFTWSGLAIAFFTPYPVSFFITTIAFGAYVLARLITRRGRQRA